MRQFPPSRIVCLTEETVETLYLLGEEHRIAGVSGYCVRPARVRREKPRVSAFTSANIPKILALEPDLVLAFSDLQADIVAELIHAGVAVHAFNQRDVAGILAMIRALGALIGAGVFMIAQDFLSGVSHVYWQFWIGLFLVVIVMLARGGILGGLWKLAARLRARAR